MVRDSSSPRDAQAPPGKCARVITRAALSRRTPLLLAPLFFLACSADPLPELLPDSADGSAPSAPREGPPARVISLAPSFTEIIFALGADELLVGVTPYCRFPPEAKKKPRVGALVNISYERLLSLDPDLVILLPGHAEIERKLHGLDIGTITLPTESLADLYHDVAELGRVLGRAAEAERLNAHLREQMAEIAADYGSKLRNDRVRSDAPRVLFVAGRNPGTLQQIYACGSGNFVHEMLEAVGAVNVMGRTLSPWPIVSKEAIIALDPDVILDGSQYTRDAVIDSEAHMKAWEQLPMLRAVSEGRVLALHDERLTIPGPGIIDSARALAALIHRRPMGDFADPPAN